MAINLLSPGIEIREFDLTFGVTPVRRRPIGAIVGVFPQGPINEPYLVRAPGALPIVFGEPDGGNDETFFTAQTYLRYSDRLYVVRVANNEPYNAYAKTKTEIDTVSVSTQSGVFSNSDVINISGGTTYTAANLSVTTNSNGAITALALVNNGVYLSSDFPTSGDGLLNVVANNISNSSPTLTVNLTYRPVSVANQVSFTINNYMTLSAQGRNVVDDTQWRAKITANGYTSDTDLLWVARASGNTYNGLRVSTCDSSNAYGQNLSPVFTAASANVIFVQGSKYANIVTSSAGQAANVSAAFSYRDSLAVRLLPTTAGGTNGFDTIYTTIVSKRVVGSNVMLTFESNWPRTTTQSFVVNGSGNFKYNSTNQQAVILRHWEFGPGSNKVFDPPRASDTSNNSFLKRTSGSQTYFVNDRVYTVVADKDNKVLYSSSGTRARLGNIPSNKRPMYGALYHIAINNDINNSYVWWANHRPGLTLEDTQTMQNLNTLPYHAFIGNGSDAVTEDNISLNTLMAGYDLFKDKEKIDVDHFIIGKANGGDYGEGLINYVGGEICEYRRDCMVFGSPRKSDVTNSTDLTIPQKLELFANAVIKSSFVVIDSGYKTIYDQYNDRFIDIPMNADTAGLLARTTFNAGAWHSPAGFNRGELATNSAKTLIYNPSQADRDIMYPVCVNPFVQFRGRDIILFGDKTTYNAGSAFDHINVRQLFIYLQKIIADVSKYTLFEMNDEFTRAQFIGIVDPILRDVKGRRGIYDYRLICDETNNTPDIIDSNGFVADIYVKPARSINYIQLNFIATRTGTNFNEIIGQFANLAKNRVE
jgi:hypothetical protein